MWYVVVFPQENSISAVPATWYVEETNECFWPSSKMKKRDIDHFVKRRYLPQDDWKPYKAKILGKYDDYKEALTKLAKAKDQDKLSSTDNEEVGRGKRKRRPNPYKDNLSSASEGNESTSDDSLSFPNFPETENNHASFEINSSKKQNDSASVPLQQQNHASFEINSSKEQTDSASIPLRQKRPRSPLLYTRDSGRQSFRRTLSRSLSPRNVHSEKISHLQQLIPPNDNKESTLGQVLGILQKMQADSSEFRVQVMRKLNLLNMKMNDLEISLGNINKNKDVVESTETGDEEFSNLFPLDNDEKLNNIENNLVDEAARKNLIKHLSRVGGSDVQERVKRLMYKIFTNEVGRLYSWDGAKGKKKFKHLKIADIIFNTVRANAQTNNATEAEIIIFIKKWLVRCKDRMNVENKKSRPNQSEEAGPD